MFRVTISNGMWARFNETLRKILFFPSSHKYDFGYGLKDVRTVCKYHLEDDTNKILTTILVSNNLIHKTSEYTTVARIMKWLNTTYPSSIYYVLDKGDTWNTPTETLQSLTRKKLLVNGMPNLPLSIYRKNIAWTESKSTDCDDYAILLYNLCRCANVNPDNLYLCWMKTTGEWHMNVMYFSDGVPYALEGTYNPSQAMQKFGRENYFNTEYYRYVKWIFNEKEVFRYSDKINPLGTL